MPIKCPTYVPALNLALDEAETKRQVKIFKALANETRLKILTFLRQGRLCVCEIVEALQMPQSTVSHHLYILVSVGFVNNRKTGKWVYYSLEPKILKKYKVF